MSIRQVVEEAWSLASLGWINRHVDSMIELVKTNGEKLRPFSESSRLYTVCEKKNDPYIDPFIDSDLSFPDPPIIASA